MLHKKRFYEQYHKKTQFQTKVIQKKNFTYRLILNVLTPYLSNKKKILDIGCGAGTLSLYMATVNPNNYVRGIDISPGAIRACRISARKLGIERNTTFQATSFPETTLKESFNLILCTEILEHLK